MVNRVFIYGYFMEREPTGLYRLTPPPGTLPSEAIEILREPSVVELIGKVWVLTSARNYQAVTPFGVTNFQWFQNFQRASKEGTPFYFKAEHGDKWNVRWFRQESDESGPYIAAGLQHV